MTKKHRISVILTQEALSILKDQSSIIKKEGYINCESVEQDGYFINLKVSVSQSKYPDDKINHHIFVLSIPVNYVLYMVSGDANKILGFEID